MGLQLPDDIEMEDEQAQIHKAKAVVHKDGEEEEIRDFETALRIARQDSVAAGRPCIHWQWSTRCRLQHKEEFSLH
jgi:hypothetical protein